VLLYLDCTLLSGHCFRVCVEFESVLYYLDTALESVEFESVLYYLDTALESVLNLNI